MEFIKEHNEKGFWTIKSPEGHFITDYKEGDDIKDYSAFVIAYCPENADFSQYRLITAEEHNAYLEAYDRAWAAEMEEDRNGKDE